MRSPEPASPHRHAMRSVRAAAWGAALALFAAVLCFVPLFDLLGYESSFAVGLLAAFAAADLGILAADRFRAAPAPAESGSRAARPLASIAAVYRDALAAGLAVCAPAFALLLLNALRVRNCDPAAGAAWFALLAVGDVACGAGAGALVGLALGERRPRTARAAALGVLCASLVWGVYRFWSTPAIFAYDPFAGFFSGSIYDEALGISATLVAYRAMNALLLLGALGAAALFYDPERRGLALRPRLRRPVPAAAILLAAAGLGGGGALFLLRGRLGFAPDAQDIERALGGVRETPHFRIVYPAGSATERDIDLVARDHELRYAELRATFGVEPIRPGERITSFLFASADQKRRLMGAADTFIAKPWLRQIYLQAEPFPEPILEHELAHVFAGAFGDPIFHVAARIRWVGPLPVPQINVGLIEGAAVAADWAEPDERLTPHQWSRAMDELGLLPDLRGVFGLAFLGASPAVSYTVAGSFCRWLLETRGVARFRRLYRSAGDFAGAYGEDLGALEKEWRAFLAGTPLAPSDLDVARERFRRPSVFHKPCAHALALARRRADVLLAAGQRAAALAAFEGLCADEPGEPSHLRDLMMAADDAGDATVARQTAERLLAHAGASTPLRADAIEEEGDLAWRAGDVAGARAAYARGALLPTDLPHHRLAIAKATAAADPVAGALLERFFLGERDRDGRPHRDDAVGMYLLAEAAASAPRSGLVQYLLGRQLLGRDFPADARPYLERARALGLPDGTFDREDLRLLAQADYRTGDRTAAIDALRALDVAGTPLAERLAAADFERRISWEAGAPLPALLPP